MTDDGGMIDEDIDEIVFARLRKPRIDIEEVKRLVDDVSMRAYLEGARNAGVSEEIDKKKIAMTAKRPLINYIQERI